jgi:hypothetical protein
MLGRRGFSLLLLAATLGGCGGYEIKNLVKSDINLVTDEFIAETRTLVRELMLKLYARNPDQLHRAGLANADTRLRQLQETPGPLLFHELNSAQDIDALELVFDPGFAGDRVFALTVGLGGMLRKAMATIPSLLCLTPWMQPRWKPAPETSRFCSGVSRTIASTTIHRFL